MEYTQDKIKDLLQKSDRAVERGLVAIFNRQTEDEQVAQETKYNNTIGFSGAHAITGSYLAKWVIDGKSLSGKFLNKGRGLILHYTRQLTEIANQGQG